MSTIHLAEALESLKPARPERRKSLTVLLQVVSDLALLAAIAYGAMLGRTLLPGTVQLEDYVLLWPALLLFPLAYAVLGLYPGYGVTPPDELRRLTIGTTIVFMCLAAASFIFKDGHELSRLVFVVSWLLALVLMPVIRSGVKQVLHVAGLWGTPTLVVGSSPFANYVFARLEAKPQLGFLPVALSVGAPNQSEGSKLDGRKLERLAEEHGINYAVIAAETLATGHLDSFLKQLREVRNILVVPREFALGSMWVSGCEVDGLIGLRLRQHLLQPIALWAKRMLDIILVLLVAIPALFLVLVVGLLIRLDSPGPVFYTQERVGRNGKSISVWKFRTMVRNADEVLEELLRSDEEARSQWEAHQKLLDDPRITTVGEWLRKFSIDEVPQLWNVLRGDMSLVGPRPMMVSQVPLYGDEFELYTRVRPGITGLWQVSGRNETTFEERARLDAYYVRNWSIWLDLVILARTVPVVLFGRGAY